MALVRCPQCGRVADGISCFACGYEWSDDAARSTSDAVPADAGQSKAADPPSEESAPVFIEELPARTMTPPPVSIPGIEETNAQQIAVEKLGAEAPRGVTADLSEVLSDLDLPPTAPPTSDSLEFDLGLTATEPSAPSGIPPAAKDDSLSMDFSLDVDVEPATPSVPSPAPPPQLPEDFDVEFGLPLASVDVDAPSGLALGDQDEDSARSNTSTGGDLGADLDDLALADIDLGTSELDTSELTAALPSDPDDFDLGVTTAPGSEGIADALSNFGAPEIPNAMRLEPQDVADRFDPFAETAAEPPEPPSSPRSSPPAIPREEAPIDLSGMGMPEIDAPGGRMPDAPMTDMEMPDLDSLDIEVPTRGGAPKEVPYAQRLLQRIDELATTLEGEGRFDDASVLYEVQELLRGQSK